MDQVTAEGVTLLVMGAETGATLSFLTDERLPGNINMTASDPVKLTVIPDVNGPTGVSEAGPKLQVKQAEAEEFILTDTESFEPSEEDSPIPVLPEEVQQIDEKSPFTVVASHADSNLLSKQEMSAMIKTNIEQKEIILQENILVKESQKVIPETSTAPPPGDEPPSDNPPQPSQPQEAKPKRKKFYGMFSSLFCCLGDDRASEQQSERA